MFNSALATVSLTTHLLTKLGQPECNLEIIIIVVRLWGLIDLKIAIASEVSVPLVFSEYSLCLP